MANRPASPTAAPSASALPRAKPCASSTQLAWPMAAAMKAPPVPAPSNPLPTPPTCATLTATRSAPTASTTANKLQEDFPPPPDKAKRVSLFAFFIPYLVSPLLQNDICINMALQKLVAKPLKLHKLNH